MSDSRTFLPTTCPECAGHTKRTVCSKCYLPFFTNPSCACGAPPIVGVCDLCKGKGVVSHFLAAAWFSEHPEAARADTEREFPAVTLDDSNKGERGP